VDIIFSNSWSNHESIHDRSIIERLKIKEEYIEVDFMFGSGIRFVKNQCGVCWRSRIRCYGPTSHRKGGREVKEGEAPMTKVGSMSSGTCTCEAREESVRRQDA